MKFSTVLGTFAISTLEAYHAYGSPLEGVSLEARPLQARNIEYCCVVVTKSGGHIIHSEFVAWTGVLAAVHGVKGCPIEMTQTSTPPSLGGCAQWKAAMDTESASCRVSVSVAPANECK
ncbi:hypothetical protein E4U12_004043 [Claviceps purpurea]|nr:hypothetical protein E4U12_004043 [Claviceps purpurea]